MIAAWWLPLAFVAGAVVGFLAAMLLVSSLRSDILVRLQRMRLRLHDGVMPGRYLLDVSLFELVVMSEWATDDGRMELATFFEGGPLGAVRGSLTYSLYIDTFPKEMKL